MSDDRWTRFREYLAVRIADSEGDIWESGREWCDLSEEGKRRYRDLANDVMWLLRRVDPAELREILLSDPPEEDT